MEDLLHFTGRYTGYQFIPDDSDSHLTAIQVHEPTKHFFDLHVPLELGEGFQPNLIDVCFKRLVIGHPCEIGPCQWAAGLSPDVVTRPGSRPQVRKLTVKIL